ncbi:MAG: response regulator with CheY-like receiver domain and winged-helix DNA-binding domain [Candidatus Doudnabacteria bacterium]|nr:response regulator with CheY-like receiver domain and winged-helix DNA-binding domain [Candidatus Doudnabacteria bacterium]
MKALIIEDDPSVAKVILMGLRNERIDCDHAPDGATGLRMAVANTYDVIILDLLLPSKTGEDVCRQLRNANFNMVIIALTALTDLSTKIKMFNLGIDDFLGKPFEFPELFARIKSSLRKQQVEIASVLVYDDLNLDLKKHEVTRNGNKIELRDKEIKILEYLMRHAEQVLTREMILNYVWGPSVERFTNVVDVHMHNLRDKIDKPFGTKTVRTVNNVGYKLKK